MLKPIGNYQVNVSGGERNVFHPDQNQKVKFHFSCEPRNNIDAKEIKMELNGDCLQKILTGP